MKTPPLAVLSLDSGAAATLLRVGETRASGSIYCRVAEDPDYLQLVTGSLQ
jgi:hypothetical protein